jgi:hypothetical protein
LAPQGGTAAIDYLVAEHGTDNETATAALMLAGGDVINAASQIHQWQQQQQGQQRRT